MISRPRVGDVLICLALYLGCHPLLGQTSFLRKDLPIGDRPSTVTVGDFNGDSRLDLVVTTRDGLSVLLNLSGGNFAPPLHTELSGPLNQPASADFNSDGRLDLFIGGRLLFGRGNGAFLPPREAGLADFAATGDFNGDRLPDLVVTNSREGSLEVWLGDGEGSFQTSARIEVVASQPHIADFNRDGRRDLAVLGPQNTLSIFLGQGDGTFGSPIRTEVDAWGIFPGDFNRDGLPDVATTSAVLLGKGDGAFQPPLQYPRPGAGVTQGTDPFPYAAADFNGDGYLDLVTTYFGEAIVNHISVFQGKGDGTLLPSVEYAVGWSAGYATATDLDGDGRPDLTIVNFRSNSLSLLLSRAQEGPSLNRAVSAASGTAIVAPESLASLYAATGATATLSSAAPYPMRLGGISLEVRDSVGTTRPAPLLFVSPTQINFQVPSGTALGEATLVIIGDRGSSPVGSMQVDAVAPGLFMVSYPNATPAALGVRVAPDGGQTPVPVFNCFGPPGASSFSCGPAAIRLAGGPIYLSFYATGFRRATPGNVTASINGVALPVEYAGPQGTPGVDQINVRLLLPETGNISLAFLTLAIDGVVANTALLQLVR